MNQGNKILNWFFIVLIFIYLSTLLFSGLNNTLSYVNTYSPNSKPINLGEISFLDRQNDVEISTKFKLPESKNKINKTLLFFRIHNKYI